MHREMFWIMPPQVLQIIIVAMGLGMILGLIRGRVILAALLLFFLLPLLPQLTPFATSLFNSLPLWARWVITGFLTLSILRTVAALLIGWRASDAMAGSLAADLVRFAVRTLFLPLQLIRWILRV